MNRLADTTQSNAVGDGDGHLADHLAGVRGHQRGAHDAVGAGGHVHLQEAVRFVVETRPVVVLEIHANRVDAYALCGGVLHGHADVRDLGVGVCDPWDDQGTRAPATDAEKERVGDN